MSTREAVGRAVKFFDWRFLYALAVCLGLIIAGLSWHTSALDAQAKGRRVDALIRTVQRQQADETTRERESAAERTLLLENQNKILARQATTEQSLRRAEHNQRRLLRWLQQHGIILPTALVRRIDVEHVIRTVKVPSPTRAPSKPARPPSAPAPAPTQGWVSGNGTAPGNSGNAPGHNKH